MCFAQVATGAATDVATDADLCEPVQPLRTFSELGIVMTGESEPPQLNKTFSELGVVVEEDNVSWCHGIRSMEINVTQIWYTCFSQGGYRRKCSRSVAKRFGDHG